MKKLLCPSMMCADFGNLAKEVELLEQAGIDIFHLDVMDGNFVPNFGMGLQDIEFICKQAKKPCDVHLMVNNPGNYVDKFVALGAKIIYVHPESDQHITRTLQKIKDAGAVPAIIINPGTSFESVQETLYLAEYVMIMSVNPGFSGQQYLDYVDNKIKRFCEQQSNYNYKVMIDGACSPERIASLSKVGVTGFVLGTSALFGKGDYRERISELRSL